jgi:8-oxo-dGTP pyrophosphatase MutT (NUDIX family)
MNYVCGILFNWKLTEFLLIRKNRPDWAKGKWNGIGGKIETYLENIKTKERRLAIAGQTILIPGEFSLADYITIIETPLEAMVREFHEETGIQTTPNRWHCFLIEEFKTGPDEQENIKVYYFAAFGDETKRNWIGQSPTDEEVKTHTLVDVFWDQDQYMYNLYYQLHMVIYNMRKGFFFKLNPQGVNSK